jgi:hypothetical protein
MGSWTSEVSVSETNGGLEIRYLDRPRNEKGR